MELLIVIGLAQTNENESLPMVKIVGLENESRGVVIEYSVVP